jgi:hypothetical protein
LSIELRTEASVASGEDFSKFISVKAGGPVPRLKTVAKRIEVQPVEKGVSECQ